MSEVNRYLRLDSEARPPSFDCELFILLPNGNFCWPMFFRGLARQILCKVASMENTNARRGKNELHVIPLLPNSRGTVSVAPLKTDYVFASMIKFTYSGSK